jgi:hypothetical protein
MKEIYFHENNYHSKTRKPLPSWLPEQREAWNAGYEFGLTGVKKPFNPNCLRFWNFGFETAMNERRRLEEALCM